MNQAEINKECETCKLKKCPSNCFDRHVGSIIALKKLASNLDVKVNIITDQEDS